MQLIEELDDEDMPYEEEDMPYEEEAVEELDDTSLAGSNSISQILKML